MTDPQPATPVSPGQIDPNLVQGIGLAGFRKDHQQLLCLSWPNPAAGRELIASLTPLVATDQEVRTFNSLFSEIRQRRQSGRLAEGGVTATWVAVGISGAGYQSLGVDIGSQLPAGDGVAAFLAGMASRSEVLADPDPASWRPGIAGAHAVVVGASDRSEDLDVTVTFVLDLVSSCGATVTYTEGGCTLPAPLTGHEHFGFKDGVSQPSVAGYDNPVPGGPPQTALGEFVLGYPDATSTTPTVGSDAVNGSFLVFRRLSQDVTGFQQQAATAAAAVNPPVTQDLMAAKMVGRWPSGSPLELNPANDPGPEGVTNDFTYQAAGDDDGHVVPQWAHIRKVNPRDETQPPTVPEDLQRHRMIRRGIPFTTTSPAGTDVGLHFMAIVADIVRQFEFIQRSWLNDPNFPNGGQPSTPGQPPYTPPSPGVPSAGVDPIGANYPAGSQDAYLPSSGATAQLIALAHQFVHMTGGEYFFVPSIAALQRLGQS
jgi:Dyp-type peroxidase family